MIVFLIIRNNGKDRYQIKKMFKISIIKIIILRIQNKIFNKKQFKMIVGINFKIIK